MLEQHFLLEWPCYEVWKIFWSFCALLIKLAPMMYHRIVNWMQCILCISYFLSPCNALRWGYSNAAVVPSVCAWFRPSVGGHCEHDRDYTAAYFFVKLGRHVNHDERMHPIDFGGQRLKVKVTMDIYGNKLVNMIETKLLCISLSNLADMLTMAREWTLLILEVKGQGHNGHNGNKLVNMKGTKPLCASW